MTKTEGERTEERKDTERKEKSLQSQQQKKKWKQ